MHIHWLHCKAKKETVKIVHDFRTTNGHQTHLEWLPSWTWLNRTEAWWPLPKDLPKQEGSHTCSLRLKTEETCWQQTKRKILIVSFSVFSTSSWWHSCNGYRLRKRHMLFQCNKLTCIRRELEQQDATGTQRDKSQAKAQGIDWGTRAPAWPWTAPAGSRGWGVGSHTDRGKLDEECLHSLEKQRHGFICW